MALRHWLSQLFRPWGCTSAKQKLKTRIIRGKSQLIRGPTTVFFLILFPSSNLFLSSHFLIQHFNFFSQWMTDIDFFFQCFRSFLKCVEWLIKLPRHIIIRIQKWGNFKKLIIICFSYITAFQVTNDLSVMYFLFLSIMWII